MRCRMLRISSRYARRAANSASEDSRFSSVSPVIAENASPMRFKVAWVSRSDPPARSVTEDSSSLSSASPSTSSANSSGPSRL